MLPPSSDYLAMVGYQGVYLKEIRTPDGRILTNHRVPADSTSAIQVVLGTDAGSLNASVTDRDAKPIVNALVCVVPASSQTVEDVAAGAVCNSVDSGTGSASFELPPDRYFAVAFPEPEPPGRMQRLFYTRTGGSLIVIEPNGSAVASLTLSHP
jgi:hypothetical protein